MVWGTSAVDDGRTELLSSCGSIASRGWHCRGLDVKDTELCDDVEWINADWELDRAGGTDFAPVESIEE